MSQVIFHITSRKEWAAAQAAGEYTPQSFGREGFIHCSTLSQVLRVANTWYQGQADLVLLQIDPAALQHDLRWEPGTDKADELFPHIYGTLNLDAVRGVHDLNLDPAGNFLLPAELT